MGQHKKKANANATHSFQPIEKEINTVHRKSLPSKTCAMPPAAPATRSLPVRSQLAFSASNCSAIYLSTTTSLLLSPRTDWYQAFVSPSQARIAWAALADQVKDERVGRGEAEEKKSWELGLGGLVCSSYQLIRKLKVCLCRTYLSSYLTIKLGLGIVFERTIELGQGVRMLYFHTQHTQCDSGFLAG